METKVKKLTVEEIAILTNSKAAVRASSKNCNDYNYLSISENLDIICDTLKINVDSEVSKYIKTNANEWATDKTDYHVAVNPKAAIFKKALRKAIRYYLANKDVNDNAKQLIKRLTMC